MGLAQPFAKEPVIKPWLFSCDNDDIVISQRKNQCQIIVNYTPDKRVGLSKVTIQLVHEYSDMLTPAGKQFDEPMIYSKENGKLPALTCDELRCELAFGFEVYLWSPSKTFKRSRAKMTFRFANGIEYQKEIAIRVR